MGTGRRAAAVTLLVLAGGDGLCLDAPTCVQVWMAGSRVEFRRGDGTLPDEGVLQVPARCP